MMVIYRVVIGTLLFLGASYVRAMDDPAIKSIVTSYHKKEWISIKDEIRKAWQGWSKITESNAKIEKAVQIIDLNDEGLKVSPDFNPNFCEFVSYFMLYFIQDRSLTNAEKLSLVEALAGYSRYGMHSYAYMAGILGDTSKRTLISAVIKAQFLPQDDLDVNIVHTEQFKRLHTAYSLYRNSVVIPGPIKEQFVQHSFVDSVRIRFSHMRGRFGIALGAIVAIGLCYAIYTKYYASKEEESDEKEEQETRENGQINGGPGEIT
jgi:hypothetical protein